MIDELQRAIHNYRHKWQMLVAERRDRQFFEDLRPTAVAWKTKDLADYTVRLAELRGVSDQIFEAWMNERWIATVYLRSALLPLQLRVIKIMQRRPGSTDAVGLDHLDFYTPHGERIEPTLSAEHDLQWNYEKNNAAWYSVWFAGGEAKLRSDTVCGVCAQEILDTQKEVLA